MITKEQAIAIAKKILPKLNSVTEELKAYIFTNTSAKGNEIWDNEVVVLKNTGKVVSYSQYVMEIK